MVAVAVAAGAVLTIIAALLAVPVVVMVDVGEKSLVRWQVSWLYGLVTRRSATGDAAGSASRNPGFTEQVPPVTSHRRGAGRAGLAVLRTNGLLRRVTQLVLSLLKRVRIERLRLDVAFGFENPADTGLVFGGLSPILVLARTRGLDVHCRPMFWENGVRGSLGATLHIRPLPVVATLGAFLVSPPVLRAMRAAWGAKS